MKKKLTYGDKWSYAIISVGAVLGMVLGIAILLSR